jgi:hypothetical protein
MSPHTAAYDSSATFPRERRAPARLYSPCAVLQACTNWLLTEDGQRYTARQEPRPPNVPTIWERRAPARHILHYLSARRADSTEPFSRLPLRALRPSVKPFPLLQNFIVHNSSFIDSPPSLCPAAQDYSQPAP